MTLAKSPDRNTFQKENYLKRQAEKGKTPENDEDTKSMLEYYESWDTQEDENEANPNWRNYNLEYDLRSTDWIVEKARAHDYYAQNIYAAMCNQDWAKYTEGDSIETFRNLGEDFWSCSWRYAGGIVAHLRGEGDYIDWYCSGISNAGYDNDDTEEEWQKRTGYVPEGVVTEEIQNDFAKLGWIPVDSKED